jgi:protein involved in polysaccharide export with SLBB domain
MSFEFIMKLDVIRKIFVMKKLKPERKGRSFSFLYTALILLFSGLLSGCNNKFFDPTQVGRFRPVPAVNVILDSLGVAEEEPEAWEGAEEPLPIDTVVTRSDYEFMPGDVINVSIFELLQEGVQYTNNYIVTETGKISIPEVGVIQAAGMSETQLEDQIKKILSPNILKEPSVTVALVRSQQRAFSVIGDGVSLPGRYMIPRYDFRLTDALATAGGPRQFNVSYIYVSRYAGSKQQVPDSGNPGFGELKLKAVEPDTINPIRKRTNSVTPRAQYQWPKSNVVIASSEMATDGERASVPSSFGQFNNPVSSWLYAKDVGISNSLPDSREQVEAPSVEDILKELSKRSGQASQQKPALPQRGTEGQVNTEEKSTAPITPTGTQGTGELLDQNANIEWVFRNGKWIPVQVGAGKPAEQEAEKEKEQQPTGHIEWVFQNGKWVPVQVGTPKPSAPVIKVKPEQPVPVPPEQPAPVVGAPKVAAETRLIRIPADKLLAGDPQYNIVIKSGDSIFVPVDIVGEFCIMGNVNRTGYIPLTGRPMTLKQAIAAAGGLGPLAWPKKCEVVRRIGRKKEEIVMVDLDKIASGEQPDFFIKPHDLINVGTHVTSRWRAILRNAFRATYGFGFVYDRNFAYKDYYGTTFNPLRPWEWDNIW